MQLSTEATEAVTIEVGGIKCDNPECGYTDPTAKRENFKDYLNKPCPECGENLLTQEDIDAVEAMEVMAKEINGLFPDLDTSEEKHCIKAEMNGTGTVEFKDCK